MRRTLPLTMENLNPIGIFVRPVLDIRSPPGGPGPRHRILYINLGGSLQLSSSISRRLVYIYETSSMHMT